MKILAVDDDPVFLEILTKVLDSAGYEDLVTCRSAKVALEWLFNEPSCFDCFLLDISMPEEDGISLCKKIRAMKGYEETPILMITASCDLSHIEKAFSVGATDYVSKPLRGLELGSRIRIAAHFRQQARRLSRMTAVANNRMPNTRLEAENCFENELSIQRVPGIQEFQSLENDLLKLPDGSYNLGVFSLKVEGAEELFSKFGVNCFHEIMTGLANSLSKELDLTKFSFAYAGKGVFGCVFYGRDVRPDVAQLQQRFCRKRQICVLPEEGRTIEIRFILTAPQSQNVWTGRSAAAALWKTVEKAEMRAADMLVQRKLDAKGLNVAIRPRKHKIGFRCHM